MTRLFRRNFWISSWIHLTVILVMVLIPAILNWRVRRKPHEIITYVDIQSVAPEPPGPAPVPEVKPPEPPKDIPEPPKKKKIEISKKKIKKPDEPKPQKQMTPEEIRKLLDSGAKPSRPAGAATLDSLPGWYYALVRQKMYEAWIQPGGLSASAGLVTRVEIRVERGGGISRRNMIRSSGHKVMDDSVMKAVNSISQLPALPAQFPDRHKDITIDFELTRGQL
ncbi:MAG: TonB family protein [Kiritimatiellae bacterium]|nr:TonB family protein [Kiritimatiellia bacterium]